MWDWLVKLFSADFMPHGHCYFWEPGMVWLQVVSNLSIGLAYLSISATLIYTVRRAPDVPFQWIYLAFGLFIVSCGFTHFMDVWVIWTPVYWLDGSLRALTALVSVGTALLLFPLVPKAIALARAARVARERGTQLEQLNVELAALYEQTRESAAEERERVLAQLREAVRTRDVFLAVAAHELRTPLTPLRLEVERLLKAARAGQADRLAPERAAERLQIVERQLGRLEERVDALLDVTRIAGGRFELHLEDVDLGAVVAEVAERLERDAKRAGCALTVRAEPGIVGHWDRLRLDQVVTNLVSNALRYGQGKPVTIEARAEDGRARLQVSDQGIGIAPEDQARIFERFERAASERHYGGLGLGLWIVHQVVEALGGSIRVESALGEGATFVVELPLTRGAPRAG